MTGRPGTDPRAPGWAPFSPTGGFMPREYANDFKGRAPTLDDPPLLRWVVAHRYPEGIDVEEADDWWLNVHVPEVCQQKGLRRFVSTKFCAFPSVSPMVRWSEYWYDNGSSWVNAEKNPPRYTKPPWASRPRYPFLLPYIEFTSTFLLESPQRGLPWDLDRIRPGMKALLMANLQSMDHLPTMERWFLTRHVDETLRTAGARLDRYFSHRAVLMPEGENPADWGYYNWRVIELWWHTAPVDVPPEDVTEMTGATWPPEYDAYLGDPGMEASAGRWAPRAPISGYVNRRFTNDFKGAGRTLDDGPSALGGCSQVSDRR